MKQSSQLGAALKAYRQEQGLTQAELAEQLEVTDKTVSKWELGLTSPSKRHLAKLYDITGIVVTPDLPEKADKSDAHYTSAFAMGLSLLSMPLVLIYHGFTGPVIIREGSPFHSTTFPLVKILVLFAGMQVLVHGFTWLTKGRFVPLYKKWFGRSLIPVRK